MLTNLLATIIVSLVTNTVENVTEWDHMEPVPCDHHPQQQIWGGLSFYNGCLLSHMKGVGPKRKERITTIKEVSTLTFDWLGKREVVSERVVSETREAFALEWNRAELKKQEPIPIGSSSVVYLTNDLIYSKQWGGTITNNNTLELRSGLNTNLINLR